MNSTLPIQGTDIAQSWDALYMFLVWLSAFFFVLVCGAMILFAVQYRRSAGQKTKYITHHFWLEVFWIAIPTVLLMVIFGWGYQVYHKMVNAPSDAYEIRVVGKQWLWQFQYDNGTSTINELYVPGNRPVKLIMSSQDVLHSMFIPAFRVKQDVVPGMYTSVWFEAKILGRHHLFCTEYCGASHSGMIGEVIVLDDQQWEAWYAGKKLAAVESADVIQTGQASPSGLAMQGQKLFQEKGCIACHSTEVGGKTTGPNLVGIFGKQVSFADRTKAIADENYLRESIELPNAKITAGYGPVMPTYKGMVTELEMNALVAYMKSLGAKK